MPVLLWHTPRPQTTDADTADSRHNSTRPQIQDLATAPTADSTAPADRTAPPTAPQNAAKRQQFARQQFSTSHLATAHRRQHPPTAPAASTADSTHRHRHRHRTEPHPIGTEPHSTGTDTAQGEKSRCYFSAAAVFSFAAAAFLAFAAARSSRAAVLRRCRRISATADRIMRSQSIPF